MSNFEIAVKIDKLNDELDKAIGLTLETPRISYETAKVRKILANVSEEMSNLVDELNEEE